MVGFEKQKEALAGLNARVVAASVDPIDKATEVQNDVSFPIGFGATRADADAMGAWWGEPRNIIQPAEFIIGTDGKVISSTYSSGPIGRMEPTDAVRMLTRLESQK